jgi:hypothetical protein
MDSNDPNWGDWRTNRMTEAQAAQMLRLLEQILSQLQDIEAAINAHE